MKHYALAVLGFVAVAAVAQTGKGVFADIAIQMQEPLKKLKALDEDDKKLRTSEQAQIFANEAVQKQRADIQSEMNDLQVVANGADRMRQDIVSRGCPENGGVTSKELADMCNPLIETHANMAARIMDRVNKVKERQAMVDQLEANISVTVLANVQERKRIDGERSDLMVQRNALQDKAIGEVLLHNKLAAAAACKSACCHSVIYDGANPGQCGTGVICETFQSAGLFGAKNRICVAGQSSAP
ncbi:hypothetical protein [Sphingomonas sp.]|uniref:hypothetical protein n=1 Tax=Sphingomonas sp. TaxID=28214 RepID=UPI0025EF1F18|nr:hypothetical protein [Sphingomonas sp.]